ncbi:hypothetical protein QE430_002498 [Microbacterium testaceum]|uniref:DUF4326 domain-containing protein n=1 Tax=Microbacterium testaceum TaxID=2033 RepID=UPI00278793CB|nr:DUF4326 domain-containing protein [Microbacterium testaceum]MDQ1174191.1 hypothetical protein [Microbacterium testaceum]
MTVYDVALGASSGMAASDTKRTPKTDADYVRAVVDAALAYREPLFPVPAHRFQLSRKRGWRSPEGSVSCARPHRFGNPFIVATPANGGNITREQAVSSFRQALLDGRLQVTVAEVRRELQGRPLGCWCPLDQPCHVDVLLEVANA